MTPYTPIKPFHVLSEELGIPADQIIKLDANENPYGASPHVLDAMRQYAGDLPIYPDPASIDVRGRLAQQLSVLPDQLVMGSGADELIELLFKLFISPGDAIINCPPTFGMYTFCADVAGAREIIVERDTNFQIDVDAVEAAVKENAAKMVLLCSPNNPDGGLLPFEQVERLLRLNTIVVLDEAYIAFAAPDLAGEFGSENHTRLVAEYPNLAVLRTFSKWAGLAGLRCGYGVFSPLMARYLMTIKQPYNLNVMARAAVLASLEDMDFLTGNVQRMIAERARLYELLRTIPYLKAVPGSQSNFILTEVIGRSAAELKNALAQVGILVRYFAKPRLENHIRISIGTPDQTDKLIEALRGLE
jgi:histidinol-phosphate aminotransferase